MILPFIPITKKLVWNLQENLERIGWAIEETNVEHFEHQLKSLYVRLERFGLCIPLLDPVRIGNAEYDNTWYGFHLAFLKVLRRQVRDGDFKLEQWNSDVTRESEKRRRRIAKIMRPSSDK